MEVTLVDGTGGKASLSINKGGAVPVVPPAFTIPVFKKLDVAGTAYNFVVPVAGKFPVLTFIFLYANKNVGAGDASVQIYEADGPASTTVDKTIFELEMPKNTSVTLNPITIEVAEGVWLNSKTDDDDIFVTLGYYYAEA